MRHTILHEGGYRAALLAAAGLAALGLGVAAISRPLRRPSESQPAAVTRGSIGIDQVGATITDLRDRRP